MNEREYRALRKALDEEYLRKVAALDTVWEMVRDRPGRQPEPSRGAVMDAVRGVLPGLRNPFGMDEVMRLLGDGHPGLTKSNVSTALRRLLKAGELGLEAKGGGRRGTRYVIPGAATNPGPPPPGPRTTAVVNDIDFDDLPPPADDDDLPL